MMHRSTLDFWKKGIFSYSKQDIHFSRNATFSFRSFSTVFVHCVSWFCNRKHFSLHAYKQRPTFNEIYFFTSDSLELLKFSVVSEITGVLHRDWEQTFFWSWLFNLSDSSKYWLSRFCIHWVQTARSNATWEMDMKNSVVPSVFRKWSLLDRTTTLKPICKNRSKIKYSKESKEWDSYSNHQDDYRKSAWWRFPGERWSQVRLINCSLNKCFGL